jgi:hypothetical protein
VDRRAASVPTPRTDVSLVTAAGWAALPAVVDKAIHGVPLVLAEHGIYVRESYLAAVRSSDPAANRFISTRMARGLTRMTYAAADVVAPVAAANAAWEEALGVPRERILTIPNGVPSPATRSRRHAPRLSSALDVWTRSRTFKHSCGSRPLYCNASPTPRCCTTAPFRADKRLTRKAATDCTKSWDSGTDSASWEPRVTRPA